MNKVKYLVYLFQQPTRLRIKKILLCLVINSYKIILENFESRLDRPGSYQRKQQKYQNIHNPGESLHRNMYVCLDLFWNNPFQSGLDQYSYAFHKWYYWSLLEF